MRVLRLVSLAALLLGGCASAPAAPPARAGKAPDAPRCPPGSAEMPADARSRMAALQGDVRKCFTLSTGGAAADVKVEVTVAESGEVRDARVLGSSTAPNAVACLQKTLKGARFARFCGADVAISWTYALR